MGIRWGCAFLRTTSHVPENELQELMLQAVEMYLMDEEERIVKSSNYEGKLYTQRRHEISGGSFGCPPVLHSERGLHVHVHAIRHEGE